MRKYHLLFCAAAALALFTAPAEASVTSLRRDLVTFLGIGSAAIPAAPRLPAMPPAAIRVPAGLSDAMVQLSEIEMPALPEPQQMAAPPKPSVEISFKRFYCAEYARLRSGLAIFGDAKYWWARARNLYARLGQPVSEAVMVFKSSSRIRLGHVAVVTAVVGPREIRIDQANWQNHGEIEHDVPVRDVSKKNDWSQVRVWDIGSKSFGHVYGVNGFIARGLVRQAANN